MKIIEKLDKRQLDEIKLAEYYVENTNHGTDGHHRLNIIYILFKHIEELEHMIESNGK